MEGPKQLLEKYKSFEFIAKTRINKLIKEMFSTDIDEKHESEAEGSDIESGIPKEEG